MISSKQQHDGIAGQGPLRHEMDAHAATQRQLAELREALAEQARLRESEVKRAKENEAHLRLLLRELTHRSKNLLAVIQAMARQTARHTGDVDIFVAQFNARLQALARSHDLLVQESWHGVALDDLLRAHLEPYLAAREPRVRLDGPPHLVLKPEAAQSLGLALHELAINAAKYGSLSLPSGMVAVSWRVAESDAGIEILWEESGGPLLQQPGPRGFGSLVIEHNLARALEAEVRLAYLPQGLQAHIRLPRNQLFVG